MKTIENVHKTLQMQFILEAFSESYDKATKESDKYFVKMELCEAIKEDLFTLEDALSYMKLQPEKFSQFIALFNNVGPEIPKTGTFKPFTEPRVKIKVFTCSKEQ